MEQINLEKSTLIIKTFLKNNYIWDFLSYDPNIYIGGSLPFMCLSPKIKDSSKLQVGDIDIYTKNCPLLFRNINKCFKISNIVKTGVNVKFEIGSTDLPIQIITSSFDDFNLEVLDEYDCGMVAVGFHPFTSQFIISNRFIEQLESKQFVVIHERTNPSRVKKLKTRASELFNAKLVEIRLDSTTDYRPYWKNKVCVNTICDLMPSPPYTQLYANKYHCLGCKEKQKYLICNQCQLKLSEHFKSLIEINNFASKYKRVVVFGGLNGLGKIIADEIIIVSENSVELVRTGRAGGTNINTYPFDLEKYADKYQNSMSKYDFTGIKSSDKKSVIDSGLLEKILQADLVIFNAYQTLEGDQTIWNTNLDTFNPELSEKRFKINCWGYTGLLQEILQARKKLISNEENDIIQDQIFVWIDANESRFDGKLSDGKHLELNMAKTACKQIFYTNANQMASMGILTLCWDCGWCSFHGISVDKIASKSKYLVPPKLSSQALIAYISSLDIEQLYLEKKFIHDMTFYKCVDNSGINFTKKDNWNKQQYDNTKVLNKVYFSKEEFNKKYDEESDEEFNKEFNIEFNQEYDVEYDIESDIEFDKKYNVESDEEYNIEFNQEYDVEYE